MTELTIAVKHFEAKEYEIAFKYFIKLAESGDVDSQYYVGKLYTNGWGVELDKKEGFKWFIKAAEKNHANSQYEVAIAYDQTYDPYIYLAVRPDENKSFKWAKKAANQNHIDAQSLLGSYYLTGIGTDENEAEALKWFMKASSQGDSYASLMIAIHSEKVEDKIKWYIKAHEQGDTKAAGYIAGLYENENGKDHNYPKALKWYKTAAKNEWNTYEIQKVADFYFNGYGTQKDISKAINWYKKAAEKSCHESCFKLGTIYHDGIYVAYDPVECAKWFIKAANRMGHEPSEMYLEGLYKKGVDLGEYNQRLETLFKARNNDQLAQIEFGYKYLGYNGSESYRKELIEWLIDCANDGNADAQFLVGENYYVISDDQDQKIKWLKKASEKNHRKAQYYLAQLQECYDEAVALYIKSAEEIVESKLTLGYFYGHGIMVEKDYQKAFDWYQKAAIQIRQTSDKKELFDIGMHLNNLNMAGNDVAEISASNKDCAAQLYLGCLYEHGFEVKQDYKKALKWYQKAALQGNLKAQMRVDYLLSNKDSRYESVIDFCARPYYL